MPEFVGISWYMVVGLSRDLCTIVYADDPRPTVQPILAEISKFRAAVGRSKRLIDLNFSSGRDDPAVGQLRELANRLDDAADHIQAGDISNLVRVASAMEYLAQTWHICGEDLLEVLTNLEKILKTAGLPFGQEKVTAWGTFSQLLKRRGSAARVAFEEEGTPYDGTEQGALRESLVRIYALDSDEAAKIVWDGWATLVELCAEGRSIRYPAKLRRLLRVLVQEFAPDWDFSNHLGFRMVCDSLLGQLGENGANPDVVAELLPGCPLGKGMEFLNACRHNHALLTAMSVVGQTIDKSQRERWRCCSVGIFLEWTDSEFEHDVPDLFTAVSHNPKLRFAAATVVQAAANGNVTPDDVKALLMYLQSCGRPDTVAAIVRRSLDTSKFPIVMRAVRGEPLDGNENCDATFLSEVRACFGNGADAGSAGTARPAKGAAWHDALVAASTEDSKGVALKRVIAVAGDALQLVRKVWDDHGDKEAALSVAQFLDECREGPGLGVVLRTAKAKAALVGLILADDTAKLDALRTLLTKPGNQASSIRKILEV